MAKYGLNPPEPIARADLSPPLFLPRQSLKVPFSIFPHFVLLFRKFLHQELAFKCRAFDSFFLGKFHVPFLFLCLTGSPFSCFSSHFLA